MALVSVIVPTFNRGHLLLRALNSVVSQSFTDWELIVIDDGSTDNSAELLQCWQEAFSGPQRILQIRQKNRGVSTARNVGAHAATGSWLAFLDSDDEWLPQKLEHQVPLMDRFRWIHGEEIWIRNGVRVNAMKKHKKSGGRIFSRCVDLCCVSPSTAILDKKLFFYFAGFREDLPVCEDYDLWLKIAAEYEIGFVEDPVIIKYGGHAGQLSRAYTAMDRYRCDSLSQILNNPFLSHQEHMHVRDAIAFKSRILIKGFLKRHKESARQANFQTEI